MYAHIKRVFAVDGGAVIGKVRLICRAHLAQNSAERAIISGMRKPSPISINSPRETMTS